jgi:hypothetical protein
MRSSSTPRIILWTCKCRPPTSTRGSGRSRPKKINWPPVLPFATATSRVRAADLSKAPQTIHRADSLARYTESDNKCYVNQTQPWGGTGTKRAPDHGLQAPDYGFQTAGSRLRAPDSGPATVIRAVYAPSVIAGALALTVALMGVDLGFGFARCTWNGDELTDSGAWWLPMRRPPVEARRILEVLKPES